MSTWAFYSGEFQPYAASWARARGRKKMAPGLIAVSRMKGEDGGGEAAEEEDHKKDLLPAKKDVVEK